MFTRFMSVDALGRLHFWKFVSVLVIQARFPTRQVLVGELFLRRYLGYFDISRVEVPVLLQCFQLW